MTFLAPGALFGLALLAIPIIVHLFKPRRVRQTPFSSLRWLHLTQQRMARRIQWHQVLLFLLRAALVTLLVLALARPLVVSRDTSGSVDTVLVLDVSGSMGRQVEGRPRPLDLARDLATQRLENAQPGDRTAVLLTGDKTTVFAAWTTDAAPYLTALRSLESLPTATDLDSALPALRSLLDHRRAGASIDVCFFTDNTTGSWTPGAISSFVTGLPKDEAISYRLVDVGLPAPRNAWLASARLRETGDGAALRVQAACSGGTPQERMLHISGLSGTGDLSKAVSLQPDRSTTLDLPLPADFDRVASRVRLRLDPPDELPGDDELFVNLDTAGVARVLLIEPEAGDDSSRPGFPLRTALAALAESTSPAADYRRTLRTPTSATVDEIAAANIVLLADVSELSAAQAEALERRVREGAGAAVFLGPDVQADVYNQRLFRPLQTADCLLPSSLGGVFQVPAARGGQAVWGRWNTRHPLLAGLVDPLLGDLTQTQSKAYVRFGENVGGDILAAFDDGTPALIDRQVGMGRVVWFNASADDRWCDLPRRNSFVPLVDRLLTYLSATGSRRSFVCGQTVTLRVPDDAEEAIVESSSGKRLEAHVETTTGGRFLRFDAPMEAGFYQVTFLASATAGKETAPHWFVIQSSRAESVLAPADPDTIRAWWSPAKMELVKPSAFAAALATDDGRLMLEPWLLLLAGLVFLAEMFLVHWLCPRINPAVVVPARRRGFVAPLRDREGVAP
jgi:hypothetical protein